MSQTSSKKAAALRNTMKGHNALEKANRIPLAFIRYQDEKWRRRGLFPRDILFFSYAKKN